MDKSPIDELLDEYKFNLQGSRVLKQHDGDDLGYSHIADERFKAQLLAEIEALVEQDQFVSIADIRQLFGGKTDV